MNIDGHFIPTDLIPGLLYFTDFESKMKCERVCTAWKSSLFDIKEYQKIKEEYFAKKLFPAIDKFPKDLVDAFSMRKIFCFPIYNVNHLSVSDELNVEVTNFLLRHERNFCRGQDLNGQQYLAILYHFLTPSPKKSPHDNGVIICYEQKFDAYGFCNNNWQIMGPSVRIISFNKVKILVQNGSIDPAYGECAIILGSNKKECPRDKAKFYDFQVAVDGAIIDIRRFFNGS